VMMYFFMIRLLVCFAADYSAGGQSSGGRDVCKKYLRKKQGCWGLAQSQ